MPGIYRQTTEISGTYSPFKKQQTTVPSTKKCNSKKVSPKTKYVIESESKENNRFITPLPTIDYVDDEPDEYNYRQYYASVHSQPLVRQYTPPEKRYSASFGTRVPERKYNSSKSKFIYGNEGKRDFCLNDECYLNQNGDVRNVQNVMVNNCPLPEFNQLYIQENFE